MIRNMDRRSPNVDGPIAKTLDPAALAEMIRRLVPSLLIGILLFALTSCGRPSRNTSEAGDSAPNGRAPAAEESIDARQIIDKHNALADSAGDSTLKLHARLNENDGSVRDLNLTIYRKRQADGRRFMLIEFTAPAEERDRDGLIEISPSGEVEATRYLQGNDSFVSTKSVIGEDSLFGMSLQELVDGQLQKYDFKALGEESFASWSVHRLEGNLKQGEESKFPRLVMLVSKETGATVVAEFYDSHNELVRRLVVDRLEQIAGIWTRTHWTIENRARQKRIVFDTLKAQYDQGLSNSLFTRAHLKKIASK